MGCLTFFMFTGVFLMMGVFATTMTAYVAALFGIMGMYLTMMAGYFGAFMMLFFL